MEEVKVVKVVKSGNITRFAKGDYIVGSSNRLRRLLTMSNTWNSQIGVVEEVSLDSIFRSRDRRVLFISDVNIAGFRFNHYTIQQFKDILKR